MLGEYTLKLRMAIIFTIFLVACSNESFKTPQLNLEKVIFISEEKKVNRIDVLDLESTSINHFIINGLPKGLEPSLPVWNEKSQSFFITLSDNSNSDIYTFDKNGNNLRNLTNSKNIFESYPLPSPNGNWIVYESFDSKSDIWIMDTQGSKQKNLTPSLPQNHNPVWSKNSEEIFFSSLKEGTPNIFKINLKGELTNISQGQGIDGTFTLSPDNTIIVFDSDRDGNMDLFKVNLESLEIINLTSSTIRESEPLFSPDGKKLLFKLHNEMGFDFAILNLETSAIEKVPNNPNVYKGNAIWNSESSKIFFNSEANGQLDIFSINIENGAKVNLTNSPNINEFSPKLVNFPIK